VPTTHKGPHAAAQLTLTPNPTLTPAHMHMCTYTYRRGVPPHRIEEELERRRHASREVDVVGGGVEARICREPELEEARHARVRVVGDARAG
jgi:hypothetical protein